MKTLQSLRKKGENKLWTLCALALVSIAFGLIPMWFSCVDNRNAIFLSYFQIPLLAFLNLLPVVALAFMLYCAIGRAWIAGLIDGILCLAFGFVNYYKVSFRNEPMNFEDVTLIREAGDMTGKGYTLFLSKSMIAALLLVAAGVVFLWLFAGGRVALRPRMIGLAALFLAVFPVYKLLYSNGDIYINKTRNEAHINQWAESQIYYSKGLIYPFIYSIHTSGDPKPAGYDEKVTAAVLEQYSDAPIPDERKVDVISIMLEAYADLEHFGVEGLSEQVYAPLREIQAMSIHGDLVTNIFAGGTVNTERAFLTGFSKMGSFRGRTNAYPWYFRENGYYAEGAHPALSWFYNRENINENLGFEQYYFVGNRYEDITYDDDFIPDLEALYRGHCAASDDPYFSYHLTYQGHGPYNTDQTWWGDDYVVGGTYTQETRNVLNNYFGSVYNTTENLLAMLRNLQEFERPLIVVAFGDHMPWMGDANSIYHELGFDLDLSTESGYLNYYSTPYFIWANDAAKAVLDNEFVGDGGRVAPCFLMQKVFDECGWTGPAYMQATRPVCQAIPVPTDKGRYLLADGSFLTELAPNTEAASLAALFEHLQYYYRNHFVQQKK